MNQIIRYANYVDSTKVLGPNDRAVLWVYGCCFDCDGCIAKGYKSGTYKTHTVDEMVKWFLSTGKTHLTISGGEPFLQADALALFVNSIRQTIDMGVIIYSGFTLSELSEKSKSDEGVRTLLKLTDILIDGRYEKALDDERPYIGSSNQRIILLSDRYVDDIEKYYDTKEGRKIELKLDSEKTLLIGVPSAQQRSLWENLKQFADE